MDALNYLRIFIYTAIFFPMAAAPAGYLLGRRGKAARDSFACAVTGLEFLLFAALFAMYLRGGISADAELPGVCGMGLRFCLDGFRILYGTVAALMWFLTTLFSRQYFAHYRNRNRYYFFLLLTLGATEGVFLSDDFFTVFLFFEIMSLASYAWVAHDEKKDSLRAADTYLAVSVIGGLVMLMGIFLFYARPESQAMLWAAGLCMFFGFGAKAGAFPLHIWLPKAHPVAPAPASALLSGVLTKAGIFGVLLLSARLFYGNEIWGALLLGIGVLTMTLGAALALFSVDLKRTLACSSVSQIGFILVGIGTAALLGAENAIAVRGSILHMVNHSLIKLTLFMAAGVVFMNVHRLNLNDIQGFGRGKPLLHFIFLMGALGIGGVPLWNGYVSKTLLHEGILEYRAVVGAEGYEGLLTAGTVRGVEWIFLLSGGLTVAYMLKLYICIFVEKNCDASVQEKFDALRGKYMNRLSAAVLAVSACLLPVMGLLPDALMGKIADMGQTILGGDAAHAVRWFSAENLAGAAISIGMGILVYLLVARGWMKKKGENGKVYVDRWNPFLDLENLLYRPVLLKLLPFLCIIVCRVLDGLTDTVVVALRRTIYRDSKLPAELEEGTPFTHLAGSILNFIRDLFSRVTRKENPAKTDYVHKAALLHEEAAENAVIISRSLSFGLLLFCAGLIVTVVYLLIKA